MSSSYTGLYVQRFSDGKIHSVQVVDTVGNSIPLDPDIYEGRDVKPPIDQLPDQEDYNQNK
jgi:hypothetical protein